MSQSTESRWRLGELVELSTRYQAGEGSSRRIRWEPNERLIRYYTSIGLLDRPAEMRGRTGYYGIRHLLQLLAVKTLQARGHPLQEIQAALGGLSDAELQEVAGLPENWLQEGEAPSSPPPRAERFWERKAPALAAPAPARPTSGDDPPFQGYELAPGVLLMIDRRQYPHVDPQAIQRLGASVREALAPSKEERE